MTLRKGPWNPHGEGLMIVRLAGDVQVMSRGRPGEVQVRVKSQKYSELDISEWVACIFFAQ